MKIFEIADHHSDDRRDLVAFRPPADFPRVAEAKILIAKEDGVILGKHSHPHAEGFFLVSGNCRVKTWTATNGAQEQEIIAPIMFMFEPEEEHVVICSEGMLLVGYLPITFNEQNNIPAIHI